MKKGSLRDAVKQMWGEGLKKRREKRLDKREERWYKEDDGYW